MPQLYLSQHLSLLLNVYAMINGSILQLATNIIALSIRNLAYFVCHTVSLCFMLKLL